MNIIYYTNQDGEIDSFERGPDDLMEAWVKRDEFNEKWTIQKAHVLIVEKGSFVEYLLKNAIEYRELRGKINEIICKTAEACHGNA